MAIVVLTAFIVGGATGLGTLIGYFFGKISHRLGDIVLAFAAGVMLSAAILGLILPAIGYAGMIGLPVCVTGILAGAGVISFIDRIVPHVHRLIGKDIEHHDRPSKRDRLILFLAAMAIHNFPEGLASGVAFGTGNVQEAMLIAGGIALQNIPEGMVTITPMLAAGVKPRKALLLGLMTGVVEIVGTLVGYAAVRIMQAILPFALAFAGGTMLYVISDEMIPETHDHGNQRAATYSLLVGFCVMLVLDVLLG